MIIFKPLGSCMIFEIKYICSFRYATANFVILELIGQPYFDLKRNNSKKCMNDKCLIVLESIHWAQILKIKPHICQCNIAFMWYLHNRDTILACLGILEKISPSELVSNGNISNHNKVRRPRPKFKVSFYLYLCSNKLWKHQKINTKNNFW